jgi:hypothetical protein
LGVTGIFLDFVAAKALLGVAKTAKTHNITRNKSHWTERLFLSRFALVFPIRQFFSRSISWWHETKKADACQTSTGALVFDKGSFHGMLQGGSV